MRRSSATRTIHDWQNLPQIARVHVACVDQIDFRTPLGGQPPRKLRNHAGHLTNPGLDPNPEERLWLSLRTRPRPGYERYNQLGEAHAPFHRPIAERLDLRGTLCNRVEASRPRAFRDATKDPLCGNMFEQKASEKEAPASCSWVPVVKCIHFGIGPRRKKAKRQMMRCCGLGHAHNGIKRCIDLCQIRPVEVFGSREDLIRSPTDSS